MIHVLTLHYGTTAWVDIQRRHIEKFTERDDYAVWFAKYKAKIDQSILPKDWSIIDLDSSYVGKNEHYLQMNWIYQHVKNNINDDDIVVFMDSDAFPCSREWAPYLNTVLEKEDSVVVLHMYENRGTQHPDAYHPYPDLCFFACKKKTIEKYKLEWQLNGKPNPGFHMKDLIIKNNLLVYELKRSNIFDAHKVMFGVYGEIIYHQAAGSRAGINNGASVYTGSDLFYRRKISTSLKDLEHLLKVNGKIYDLIYNEIKNDVNCSFVRRYFMGEP